MAYTKTPMESTDQTKTIPLMFDWDSRDVTNTKDSLATNVVWDIVGNKATGEAYFQAIKREGIGLYQTPASGQSIASVFFWEEALLTVYIGSFGTTAYAQDGTVAWTVAVPSLDPSDKAGFTNFQYEDGTNQLAVLAANTLYMITPAGVVSTVTDIDFPPNVRPYVSFLDGYLFIADQAGTIWNCDNNNPLSWSASNFISSEAYADGAVALVRHGVYLVLLGTSSIEFFYDAANPTGTPLARYSATAPRIGCKGGVVACGDVIYFIGAPANGNASLFRINGLKVEPLGTFTSNRYMEVIAQSPKLDFPGHIFNINGHTLYSFSPYAAAGELAPTTAIFMYDTVTEQWSRIASPITVGFTLKSSTYVSNVTAGTEPYTLMVFAGLGQQDRSYRFQRTLYQDVGANFIVEFITNNKDFGTRRVKFGARLLLHCDSTPASSLCSVSWTDDDYLTYSPTRTMDLRYDYPHIYALGQFRRRAFKVNYFDNFPMRWQMLELDYSQGQA